MEPPFIEISVVSSADPSVSQREFLAQIYDLFHDKYHHECHIVDNGENSYVRVDFASYQEFEEIYEKPYLLYVHIYEEFIQENQAIASVFQQPYPSNPSAPNPGSEQEYDNYLVLFYRCNYPDPMRQYYLFMTTVYKYFGAEIIYEEIQGGFLRFIHTREDYEILRLPGDIIDTWKATFRIRGVDQKLPAVKRFFALLEHWKQEGMQAVEKKYAK